mgnify:CR=1 FL=1
MKELKKKLTEKLIKRVFNHSELIEEIITDFKESEEFKQLILSGVVKSFTAEQVLKELEDEENIYDARKYFKSLL